MQAAVELALIGADSLDSIAYGVRPCAKLLGVLREGRVVELLSFRHFDKDDIRKLRSLRLCKGGQVRLGRVELPGMVEVEASDGSRRNALDLDELMTVAEVADRFSRPEGVGVVRVNRVGFVLLAENDDAVCLSANITRVFADFDNEICRVCD